MNTYQDRVRAEKAALDDNLRKLQAFIWSPTFDQLPTGEQWLLTTQCHTMTTYSAILGSRIELFR